MLVGFLQLLLLALNLLLMNYFALRILQVGDGHLVIIADMLRGSQISADILGRELIHISGEANSVSVRVGPCIEVSARAAEDGMSASGVGCISTSTGSCFGQTLIGSSLGHALIGWGQLAGGGMEDSEPIGDHKLRGGGLAPGWRNETAVSIKPR